ncbi:hypothetical protein [Sulfitobacter sp. MF3-043]|uniref:hypothetical protein n=1 Tax=Sulfitobacter sediminivivens TaxID=3252902 RepID=UPI0036DDFE21
MGMTDTLFFPSDVALAAMGNTSKRWQSHLEQGKIFIESEKDANAKSERGRGKKRQLSLDAITQGSIALTLIDAGVEVKLAYRNGAEFAYTHTTSPARMIDPSLPLNPTQDRLAGKLFDEGQTILVCSTGVLAHGQNGLSFVSDADPDLAPSNELSQTANLIECVDGRPGSARILINVSMMCHRISKALDIDCQKTFGGERI